jgi:hypothetical protein
MPTHAYNSEEQWFLWVSQTKVNVTEIQGEFGNPGEAECPSLEAVTRRLVKIMTKTTVIYEVYSQVQHIRSPIQTGLQLLHTHNIMDLKVTLVHQHGILYMFIS